jgi:hypothetical protein
MATPVQFPSEVAQRIYHLIDDAKATLLMSPEGVQGQLFYGDQNRIGVTPTACVESGITQRSLAGVPSRTENELQCYIIIYWARVDETQVTKLQAEQAGEAIARYLDANLTLARSGDGGIVIHGFISSIEPGYTYRNQGKTLMQTVRLTWTGKTKTMLGA